MTCAGYAARLSASRGTRPYSTSSTASTRAMLPSDRSKGAKCRQTGSVVKKPAAIVAKSGMASVALSPTKPRSSRAAPRSKAAMASACSPPKSSISTLSQSRTAERSLRVDDGFDIAQRDAELLQAIAQALGLVCGELVESFPGRLGVVESAESRAGQADGGLGVERAGVQLERQLGGGDGALGVAFFGQNRGAQGLGERRDGARLGAQVTQHAFGFVDRLVIGRAPRGAYQSPGQNQLHERRARVVLAGVACLHHRALRFAGFDQEAGAVGAQLGIEQRRVLQAFDVGEARARGRLDPRACVRAPASTRDLVPRSSASGGTVLGSRSVVGASAEFVEEGGGSGSLPDGVARVLR